MPRRTRTKATKAAYGRGTIRLDVISNGELLAARGRVRLVARRYVTLPDCACETRPVGGGGDGGFIFSVSHANSEIEDAPGEDALRLCRSCAVKFAIAILEHEVK